MEYEIKRRWQRTAVRLICPPLEIEEWVDDTKKDMENALRVKPLDIKQQSERQFIELQSAYREAMLVLRPKKNLASLLGNKGEK